jgi:protein phosphatase
MGGHLAGEVASQWTVRTLKRELAPLFRPQDPSVTRRLDADDLAAVGSGATIRLDETDLARMLEHAIERANQVVLGYARKHSEEAADMGSTLTLAVVEGSRATVAHVGDSRAYLWRGGELRQLTDDHSVPGALLKQGQITPAEARDHPLRHVLYRCVGLKPGLEVDIGSPLALRPGDAFLLCSDGLWDMLGSTEKLASYLTPETGPLITCQRMVDAANEAGGEDNITVVLVRVEARDA